jgi:hypothetical protein
MQLADALRVPSSNQRIEMSGQAKDVFLARP